MGLSGAFAGPRDFASEAAHRYGKAIALIDDGADVPGGRHWSFADIDAEAGRLAGALLAMGIAPGERIALLCLSRAELFIALFAGQKSGILPVPLNWRLTQSELAPLLAATGARALIHDAAHQGIAEALGLPRIAIHPEGGFMLEAALPPPPRALPFDAPWYLLHTSGTTGLPKAVIQTPRTALAHAANIHDFSPLSADARGICYLPLFHTAGINLFTLPIFLAGGQSRILPRFQPGDLLASIAAGGLTHFFGVPTIYRDLSQHPDFTRPEVQAGLAGLKAPACGGAALPEDLLHLYARAGTLICNGFGMTESGPTGLLMDPSETAARIGSAGRPRPHTRARLRGVAEGQPGRGELELSGASVSPGYFGDEPATRAAFTADGWLRTGDIASRDAQGYYRIIDRVKDMFISGGENVSPAEVERVLASHPQVLEAAVVGIPDPRWGEVGLAYLLPRPGEAPDPGALALWCRARLAGYKVPARFVLVAEFPRTAAGKIRKPLLPRPR